MLKSDLDRLLKTKKDSAPLRVLDIGSSDGRMWLNGPLAEIQSQLEVTLFDPIFLDLENPVNAAGSFLKVAGGFAPSGLRELPDDSYDVVVAFDLIEHLPRHEGYMLLYEMDRMSIALSVVYTPTGFLWQPPAVNNIFNAHISGWLPKELRRLGWGSVTGIFGLKALMGSYAQPRLSASGGALAEAISLIMSLSQVLARPFPSLAHSFYATKRRKAPRITSQEIQLPG